MLLIEASRENPNNPKIQELMEATFADGEAWNVGVPTLDYWSVDEVASSDFYANQIIELNKRISELSGEIRKLTNDLELLRQSQLTIMQELSLRNAPMGKRTEIYLMVCMGVLVLLGAFVALRLGGAL